MILGAHESISGGVEKSFPLAAHDGCESLQVFVKSSNRWASKPLSDENISKFRSSAEKFGFSNLTAHSTFLVNLASDKPENVEKSITCLNDELSRCDTLGIPYNVMHPGAHMGHGDDAGIASIAANLDHVYDQGDYNAMILLETTAGQGSSIGHTIEHLAAIIDKCKHGDKIGVCLDTCHMFAAGYDIKDNYENVFTNFFSTFGNKIKVIHLNDSKKELGSRRDRHELIGDGFIGKNTFVQLVNDSRFNNILGILETPVEENYKLELNKLKSYRN